MVSLSLYDERRKLARDIGRRKVTFRFEHCTTDEHLTVDDVIEEIENRYKPRDGQPHIVEMWLVGVKPTTEHNEWKPEAIMTIEVTALINRFVFNADPELDYLDLTGVEPVI